MFSRAKAARPQTARMIALSAALLLLAAPPAEDAAHRADREATERLNRNAGKQVARRDRANDAARAAYDEALEAYRARMAAWRRRVAECEAGQYAACDR